MDLDGRVLRREIDTLDTLNLHGIFPDFSYDAKAHGRRSYQLLDVGRYIHRWD